MPYKYILLCCLVSLGLTSQAQPGYRGKKLLLLYNCRFIPTFTNYNYSANQGTLPNELGSAHEVSLEYVITRKQSLGLRYSYSRSSVDMTLIDEDDQPFDIYANSGTKPFKSYVHGIGIYTKRFYYGYENLAPRGRYFSLHADAYYSMLKDSYINNTLMAGYWGNFSVGFGIGKQLIIFNRIILDYGLESNICIPAASTVNTETFSGSVRITPDDIQQSVDNRTFSLYAFMLKVGIGFLAR